MAAMGVGSAENVLLKRLMFTVVALLVFRLGVHIPTPGVNAQALVELTSQPGGGLLKVLNMFSGGALNRFSIFALGIFPYISASIIIQIMAVVLPALEQLQKEGGVGKQKLNRITRLLALGLALFQGFIFATGLEAVPDTAAGAVVLDKGIGFQLLSALLLAGGTVFVMWLGEQITEKGLGNGSSLLIFAGIVAYFPQNLGLVVADLGQGKISIIHALFILVLAIASVFGVAFIEQSYRKIPIHYARRTVGKRVMSVQSSHLPMKVNMSGVIPAIFGSTLLAVPATFMGFGGGRVANVWISDLMPNRWLYNTFFALLVIFFCYFYTSIVFKPDDIAENLKRQNAYIPGIRPGVETSEALDMVVTRLTLAGAMYMNLVCLLPVIVFKQSADYQFSLGGTSLLIVVGVGLDTVRQVSAQLATQRYENLSFFGRPQTDGTGAPASTGQPSPTST
jgi:preprotein translocase subunit SecY